MILKVSWLMIKSLTFPKCHYFFIVLANIDVFLVGGGREGILRVHFTQFYGGIWGAIS